MRIAKLFPLRGGVPVCAFSANGRGGLPNGARAKHSLETIKQGGFLCGLRSGVGPRSGSEAPKANVDCEAAVKTKTSTPPSPNIQSRKHLLIR